MFKHQKLLICILVIMISCNSSIEKKEKIHYSVFSNKFLTKANNHDLEKRMRSEGVSSELINKTLEGLNSKVQNDTTFLNYIFGMSKKEFEFHSNDLIKKGMLKKKIDFDTYLYEMSIPSYDKCEMEVVFSFYKDYLHKIKLSGYAPYTNTLDSFLFYEDLVKLYEKKYSKSHSKEDKYFFLQGNKTIKINQFKMHPITGINKKRITIIYQNLAIAMMEEYQSIENKKLEDLRTIEDI